MTASPAFEKDVEAGLDAALAADVLPIEGRPGVKIREYLRYSAADAVELGVSLIEKDGKARFHWYSDIRGDEYEEVESRILRPAIQAALRAALPPIAEGLVAAIEGRLTNSAIHLAAGEMTAQEMRTAKAVGHWLASALRAKIEEMVR